MENGGADKPGGQGGAIGAQDGNNGSNNDNDCEDDNRGQGLPGHCKANSKNAKCLPGQAHGHTNGHGPGKGGTARTTCPSAPTESSKPDNSPQTTATPATPAARDTGDTATRSNASPSTTQGSPG